MIFLASRLPKVSKTPNQKHGHVFEAILQLVPDTGTPHTTQTTPPLKRGKFWDLFFHRNVFFGLGKIDFCCYFHTVWVGNENVGDSLGKVRKILHAWKTNMEPENDGFQPESPSPRGPPFSLVLMGDYLQWWFWLGFHPPENAPSPRKPPPFFGGEPFLLSRGELCEAFLILWCFFLKDAVQNAISLVVDG